MKALVFTHKNDIDGMGNAVLAKLAFESTEYVLCGTFELKQKVNDYIESKKIYEFDNIFVTDLCLDLETLKFVSEDERLKDKLKVFDHHKTYLDDNYTKYPFVKVEIENSKGLCSGTSLFYEYLIENNILIETNVVKEFAELTRQYDTWEWKTIYNNEKARELTILFDALGTEGYINFMYEKLKTNTEFEFSELEKILINNKKQVINDRVNEYLSKIFYKEVLGLKAGIVFIEYEFRNELAEYLRVNNYDIDFVMMIAIDKGGVSYRSVKENVSVRIVAEFYGGKGHEVAATSPILKEKQEQIIDIILGDK